MQLSLSGPREGGKGKHKSRKKKLTPHLDEEEEEEFKDCQEGSVTFVNPIHAHRMAGNTPGTLCFSTTPHPPLTCVYLSPEQSKTTILKMGGGVQSLKQIQQSIKAEAGKLGQKIGGASKESQQQEKESIQQRIAEDVSELL